MSELGIWGARKFQDRLEEKRKKKGIHACPMFRCTCKTDEECRTRRCWCCNHTKVFSDTKAEAQTLDKRHRKQLDQKRRLKKRNPVASALLEIFGACRPGRF